MCERGKSELVLQQDQPVVVDGDWTLPALRRDLKLYPGPLSLDHTPTWTLHDPIRNRFFRLGWVDHLLLLHWQPGKVAFMIQHIHQQAGIKVTLPQIEAMVQFLSFHNLVKSDSKQAVHFLLHQYQAGKVGIGKWLMLHYLFFKISLVRPDPFLRALLPWVSFVYSRIFVVFLGVFGLLGIYLTARQWDGFAATFRYFFSLNGMAWYATTLVCVKLFHELGHAITACRFGCRVPSMGVAFMVMWPVLYTDTSEVWKLRSRRARFAIGAAGVGAELLIAVLATLLWNFLPEGPARSSAVLVATVTWITSLLINLNPFMRFDGYYLLCDLLGMDNLQDRAFALARWHLRELLLGLGEAPPEVYSAPRQRVILLYAYATWIYRLLLFVGIAFLVYHMVFKLAGILLMMVELVWFVTRPIWRELQAWWIRREIIHWNRHTFMTLLLLTGLIGLMVIPWQNSIEAPALVSAKNHVRLYAPLPARVTHLAVSKNQRVNQGDLLLSLQAPDLEEEITQITAQIEALQWRIDHATTQAATLENSTVMQKEMVELLTRRQGYQHRVARLQITAPFAGVVTEIEKGVIPGRWLTPTTPLIELLDPEKLHIEAFVTESEIERIVPQATGVFSANDAELSPFTVRLSGMDHTAVQFLPKPYLASLYGGSIAVWEDQHKRLVPFDAMYRMTLAPIDLPNEILYEYPGIVRMEAETKSMIQTVWRLFIRVFIRESGF